MRVIPSPFCLIALALFWLAPMTHAQKATATMEVSPNPFPPNQIVTLTITVENANPTGVPNVKLPAPLGMTGGPSVSNEISIVNGVQSILGRYTWPITCPQEGEFTIPAQEVELAGSKLTTNPLKVVVKAGAKPPAPDVPDKSQGNGLGELEPILQVHMAKTEFYQGEIIPVTATLYLPRAVQLRRLGLIEVEKEDLAIQRFPQQAEQSLETLGNTRYIALTFRSSLSALKSGKMKVGPAKTEIIVDIPLNTGRNFPFGFMQMDQRKLTVSAVAIPINVLALPQEGKPKGFSGAVGDFTMSASANATEVNVGDPVAVDVVVEGQGNFDAIDTPVLSDATGWKTYPPKRFNVDTGDPNTADLINRKVGFNHILVPEKVMSAVPSFEFSFFSPRTKQYVHLRSQPIPLQIKPSANAPVANATTAATVSNAKPVAPSTAPEADITDILMTIPAQPRWALAAQPLLGSSSYKVINLALALGLIGFIIWTLVERLQAKRANSADNARRQLLREVSAPDLTEAEFYRRAAHYVMSITGGQVPEAAQQVMEKYVSLNFAGQHAGLQPVDPAQRNAVLDLLAKMQPDRKATAQAATSVVAALLFVAMTAVGNAAPADQYQSVASALEKGDFKAAKSAGEALVKTGEISPELFTLLGHASYKQGEPGIAAIWYQRALMFPGSAPEIRQNLRHIEDKIHFFTFERNDLLEQFGYWLSRNAWVTLGTVGAWIALFCLTYLILGRRSQFKALAALGMVTGLVVVGLAALGFKARPAAEDLQPLAFVHAPKAQAHTAASQVSGSVISVPPGSVVRRLSERGSWSYVEIPQQGESLRGWLPTSELESWWPFDFAKLP